MYGFSGITDVNDSFLSMSLQRKQSINFANKSAEITISDNDVIVVSDCNGDIVQVKKNGNKIALYSPNATYVNYLIFNTNTSHTDGYGIEIYAENGRVVFSSNHKFLRPVRNVDTNLNKGVFTEQVPTGKKYGVILGNYGFKLSISPDLCRKAMRSIKVGGNIQFGIVNHDTSGVGRVGATFNDNSYFFNAIIVDITGY